jgi:Tol biopolymer transport system component
MGADTLLVHSDELKGSNTWSHDGTTVLYNRVPRGAPSDVWAVVVASGKMFPVANSGAAELDSQLSTDDRWVAYQSDQSGLFELYVQPFQRPGDRTQVTSGGGAQVRWRRDGRELYYIDLEERLIAVPIPSGTSGESLEFGSPRPLFRVRVPNGVLQPGGNHQQYLPSDDGARFLINTQLEEPDQAPLSVILNWDRSQAAR